MKKILLMTAAFLMISASAMAQVFYFSTDETNDGGQKCYRLSRDGSVLINQTSPDFSYELTDMVTADNGDLYYLNHKMPDANNTSFSTFHWTDVRRQSGSSNTCEYNCPVSQGIFLNSLAYSDEHIYAAGSYYDTDKGKRFAYITKDDELFYKIEDYSYYSNLYGITVCNGTVWTCGTESWNSSITSESNMYMQVWKDGQAFANTYSLGNYSIGYDIAVYNNIIYVCGQVKEDGVTKAALWSISYASSTDSPTVTLLGTLAPEDSDGFAIARKLYVDGGNIYMSYMIYGETTGVWKYNLRNQELSTFYTYNAANALRGNIVANNHGVYTAAGNYGYFLNGEETTTPLGNVPIRKIAVYCPLQHPVFELTEDDDFYDGFDNDDTYWDDWIKYDYDEVNGNFVSYWDRIDYSGDEYYAAWHRWGCNEEQGGDLASPAISIPSDANAKLGFYLKVWDLESYQAEGSTVWIFEDDGEPITQENYTDYSQHKIWDMDDILENVTEDWWKWVEVDLSEYKGKTIHVVFYYVGECAHAWLVDDVNVWIDSFDDVNEQFTSNLHVMPNPAKDVINVTGLKDNEEVSIYNTLGQLVKKARLSNGQSLSVSDLTAGVYVLRSASSAKAVKFTVQ